MIDTANIGGDVVNKDSLMVRVWTSVISMKLVEKWKIDLLYN